MPETIAKDYDIGWFSHEVVAAVEATPTSVSCVDVANTLFGEGATKYERSKTRVYLSRLAKRGWIARAGRGQYKPVDR